MKKSPVLILIGMLVYISASSMPGTTKSFHSDSPTSWEQIRSNLYSVEHDASTILLDGDLTQYDQSFANELDGMDARKMSNFSENLGLIRENTTLVIERRHTIQTTDTIFYKLWNVQQKNYQLEFITSNLNHPGLTGFLEDSYLHTSVPIDLNGSNNINFSVNSDPGSSAVYRFRIVFAPVAARILPLTFTSVKAYQQNNAVRVDWKTENELNIKSYNIEKSADGRQFSTVSNISPNNLPANTYTWTDAFPANGNNYYRVSSKDINDKIQYTEVLKVSSGRLQGDIKVFPNPVTDNTIHLQIVNQPEGLYEVKLINTSGQPLMTKQIQHTGGSNTETIRPGQQIPKGIYQLEITRPDGSKMNIHLMY
jgi:hypothetical protein